MTFPANNTPAPTPSTGAAILAGGASSRMGQNKALLRLEPNGLTIIERAIARLAEAGFNSPLILSNDPFTYSFTGLEIVPDEIPHLGPLGGLLTALHSSPNERVLLVACDMPFLNPPLLRYMASISANHDAIAPAWHDPAGLLRLEPLHAIYAKSALPIIEQQAANNHFRMTSLLAALDTHYLTEDEIKPHDPQLISFRNINTPDELSRLLI